MIKIFGISETSSNLSNKNGDYILNPLKAVIHKYENGDYSLELETDLEAMPFMTQDRIIVADTNLRDGMQFFRIKNVTKTRGKIKASCPHMFYDSKYRVIPCDNEVDHVAVGETYYDMLDILNTYEEAVGHSGELTISNLTPSGQTDFTQTEINMNGMSLYDMAQYLIKTFGGYLVRDKKTFGISKTRPTRDNGVTIRYGKNIRSISKSENWDAVCTYLIAVGKDGLSKDYVNPTQYTYEYVKKVEFQQNIDAKNYPSSSAYQAALIADLDAKASAYFAENSTPQINYTLDAYVGDLPNGSMPEVTDIGDQIEVIDEQLGINVLTTVLGFDYDLIGKKFQSIQFGNYTQSMRGYNEKVIDNISNLQGKVPFISYPVGSIYRTTKSSSINPNIYGLEGFWTLLSSSAGVNEWQRIS